MKILGFHSKVLKGSELNWTVTEQEFYAIISCLKKFETYLRGSKVVITTDHKALLFVKNWKLYNSRVTRWILYLEQFDYEIQHIAGKENIVADVLSRYPMHSQMIQEDKNQCPEILYMERFKNKNLNARLKELSTLQKNDKDLKIILHLLNDSRKVNDKMRRTVERCRLQDEVLYFKPDKSEKEVLFLPKVLIDDIVNQVHLEMGHQGAYKVIKYIRDRFYWKGLTKDVKRIVKTCHICQLSKSNNVKHVGPCQSIVTMNVGDLVMADLYGPLPSGVFGYANILVVQDSFSKFVKLYPLKRATAKAVVGKFKNFITIIRPKAVMTDNGKQFISKIWQETMKECGIKKIYTTVRNPRPNTTERVNKELGRIFRTFCHAHHRSWATILPKVEELYNNTFHDSTGFSPCEILYGESSRMTFDNCLPKRLNKLDIGKIREQVRINLKKASEIRQSTFNKRNKLIKFHIGDLVKIRRANKSDAQQKVISKFDLLYEGPYKIAAIPFENVYTLIDLETKHLRGNINAYNLSRYYK